MVTCRERVAKLEKILGKENNQYQNPLGIWDGTGNPPY